MRLNARLLLSTTKPVTASTLFRNMSSPKPLSPVRVAIVDDYLSTSKEHFAHIPSSQALITTFTDSLPPYSHPSTTDGQRHALVDRLKPFTVIVSMRERTPLPADLLKQLANLKLLLATGTQFQTFDLQAAKDLGIAVHSARGRGRSDKPAPPKSGDITKGGAHPTTQHTWAMILALARNVAKDDAVLKAGGWQTDLAIGLTGKTLGIVGLGRLGAAVARVGVLAWGMRVVCWSASLTQEKANQAAQELGLPVDQGGEKTFKAVEKDKLFQMADVVSVHYVLSERSKGVVGRKELEAMRTSALFVNTSRGPLADEEALLDTLEKGKIKGAALDVFDIEPLPKESPWRKTKWGEEGRSNVLLTPHMGYVEEGNMHTWYDEQAEMLEWWLEGKELPNRLA